MKALLTVPGNLLLLGEYAVLEKGGQGIGLAVERRVRIQVEEAEGLSIVGRTGNETFSWSPELGRAGLIGAVVESVKAELGRLGSGGEAPRLAISIDSSALFAEDGTKLGLGSSSAVASGLALALLRCSGIDGQALSDSSFRASLAAHRSAQGGIGSGYDVAASLRGGLVLFTGGEEPGIEALELTWMRPLHLVRGPGPVETARAIRRYQDWKARRPRAARAFLEASNEVVVEFARARDWAEATRLLNEGARLGLDLGEAIGVSARIGRLEGGAGKALGAGNEIGATWGETAAEGLEMRVSGAGPLWSE